MSTRRTFLAGSAGQMAFGGLMTALAVVIMVAGTWIPAATFCCPVLASVVLLPVLERCGVKYAFCVYVSTAVLSGLLAADKEAALIFACLGHWPVVKPHFDRISVRLVRWSAKLLVFQGALAVCYGLLFLIMTDSMVLQPDLITILVWLVGNVTFFLYDALLNRLSLRIKKRLRKGGH